MRTIREHFDKKHRNEYGLSMIELLVVIVIIGIIAAVALGVTLNQRKKANDASLKSDMHNVALAYETWRTDTDNTNAKFLELSNNSRNMMVVHSEADYIKTTSTVNWNELDETPKASASRGTFIMLTIIPKAGDREEVEGEFCLQGTHPNSSFDYKAGSGNPANYTSMLFYDSTLGGLMTIDEMAERYSGDPQDAACYRHIDAYLEAQ